MYVKYYSRRFERSVKKIVRSGQVSRELIEIVIADLAAGNQLEEKYRDHALTGEMTGHRECHIKPNLLLLYRIDNNRLILLIMDIGSHSQLFG